MISNLNSYFNKKIKIAYYILGQVRDYNKSLPSLKRYRLEPLQPDIFVATWDETGIRYQEKRPVCSASIFESILKKTYNTKACHIETCKAKYKDSLHGIGRTDSLKQHSPKSSAATISMFYLMKKCNDLKAEFEKKHKFKYDLVIKLGADLIFFKPLRFDQITTSIGYSDTLFGDMLTAGVGENGFSDQFVMGDSKSTDIISSCFDYMNHYWKTPFIKISNRDVCLSAEKLMKYHLL